MAKREFVMLAHQYNEKRHKLAGTCVSEKLDGMRCIWLPFTRGILKSEVPFANNDKDERLLDEQVSTGLWSRLGNIIHAPDYWLDQLPPINLDGELYSETMPRQNIMSVVKRLPKNRHDSDWEEVYIYAFDSPHHDVFLANGIINTTNFVKNLSGSRDWAIQNGAKKTCPKSTAFLTVQKLLASVIPKYPRTVLVHQHELSNQETKARREAFDLLDGITDRGGEGLMARALYSSYACERSHSLFKLKKLEDSDGVVTGYITGRKTDKGSKLLGLMGALVLKLDNGRTLELSGFTEAERTLQICNPEINNLSATQWAIDNPEKDVPDWIEASDFPRGTRVSFRYRGVSNDGIPNEARYWRKRQDD